MNDVMKVCSSCGLGTTPPATLLHDDQCKRLKDCI